MIKRNLKPFQKFKVIQTVGQTVSFSSYFLREKDKTSYLSRGENVEIWKNIYGGILK